MSFVFYTPSAFVAVTFFLSLSRSHAFRLRHSRRSTWPQKELKKVFVTQQQQRRKAVTKLQGISRLLVKTSGKNSSGTAFPAIVRLFPRRRPKAEWHGTGREGRRGLDGSEVSQGLLKTGALAKKAFNGVTERVFMAGIPIKGHSRHRTPWGVYGKKAKLQGRCASTR